MKSEIVGETKGVDKYNRPIFSRVGKHIRYYRSVDGRDMPDKNCTLETLQESLQKMERATGISLTRLKLGREAFALFINETDPPMTKIGIEAALGLKIKVV